VVGADWVIASVEPCGDCGLERCAIVRVDQRVLWPCAKSTAALVDRRKGIRPDLIRAIGFEISGWDALVAGAALYAAAPWPGSWLLIGTVTPGSVDPIEDMGR